MLEVKDLHKGSILQGINLTLSRGEIGILLGSSGAGKTTLLRALNRLDKVDSGSCILDAQDLAEGRTKIGMVFQQFNLFEHLTAEENILLALRHHVKQDRKTALAQVAALLERYRLTSRAKNNVKLLSGGEKQRLAIARALALKPDVICLDEPTSALDPLLTKQVAQYVRELADEGRIVLVTTHDMKLVQELDAKVFFMQEGRIVESATKNDIVVFPDLYPRLASFMMH